MTTTKTTAAIAQDFYNVISEDGYTVDKLHEGFIADALEFMVKAIESGDKEEMACELASLMNVVYVAGWDAGLEDAC